MPHRLNEITAGGRTIRWRETEPGSSRADRLEPIVLLHAFPLSAAMWEPQFDAFDGWRVIAPDIRGFRGPDGPQVERPGSPTMEELAMDVEHVLDALGVPQAVIGGLSMGGYLAFALLRRAPARFRGLILADTRAGADTEEAREGRRQMQARAEAGGARAIADEMLPKLLGETTKREQPGVARRVRELVEANSAAAINGALGAMITRQDSRPLLQTITSPTLVIVGEEDTLTPVANSEELQRGIRGSRLVTIPSAGHLSNLEQPDAFNRAVRSFLKTSFS
ncbi:MAG TPA: alpha/beta hydrolase [Vicinamibacterales bacterium]|nr:alpha/beta hydrolase [Vicinamibacterales bacterium]